jgi:CubicO group peptidase (beta-lactamase class C family)
MTFMARRTALKHIAGGLAVTASSFACSRTGASPSLREDEITLDEREAMAAVAGTFMATFDVPGLSIAIARHGHLVYQEALGMANRESGEKLSTSHLFRIASVTKPLTSVAIFTLIQQGKLRREGKVFGANGILGNKYGTPPYKVFVEDITIDHLLTHTCGGWDNGQGDPMFMDPTLDQGRLISWTLDNRSLDNFPGKHWAYSNFGYCVLGRVIEAVTQQTYQQYVQNSVLTPSGIADMRIAGNTLEQRAPNEVIYYGQNGENPYNMNVQRMDSHGGWLATPVDLVRFAMHVDGFTTTPNILTRDTIDTMTTPCDANANYARGWNVNRLGNWWHTGSLPGTTTIMVRTSSGFCWAALTNTRSQPSNAINLALDNLVWDMARKVRHWGI